MDTPSRAPQPAHGHTFANRLIPVLLRSPLHWVASSTLMLITFTGRKSGRQFTTPVTYMQEGDTIIFFSNQRWWKNLDGGAPVTLRLKGRDVAGTAIPSTDVPPLVRATRTFLTAKGVKQASMIGVEIDTQRMPTDAELTAAVQQHVVVVVTPHTT